MAASADSSASSKVLAINHSFFDFSFIFLPFYYYGNYGSYFQKEFNNEDVFTFCNNLSKN